MSTTVQTNVPVSIQKPNATVKNPTAQWGMVIAGVALTGAAIALAIMTHGAALQIIAPSVIGAGAVGCFGTAAYGFMSNRKVEKLETKQEASEVVENTKAEAEAEEQPKVPANSRRGIYAAIGLGALAAAAAGAFAYVNPAAVEMVAVEASKYAQQAVAAAQNISLSDLIAKFPPVI